MSLTTGDLDRGITCWLSETNWDRDFHNGFYASMARANPHGAFSDDWWAEFLPVLRAWRATRPRASSVLTTQARERFGALSHAWAKSVTPHLHQHTSNVAWESVAPFPTLVAEIKGVASPVFASKFCHFLAPRLFPLVDNAAMGNPYLTYEDCYRAYQSEWVATPRHTREELVFRLAGRIGSAPCEGFPFENKVTELCMIGRLHG